MATSTLVADFYLSTTAAASERQNGGGSRQIGGRRGLLRAGF